MCGRHFGGRGGVSAVAAQSGILLSLVMSLYCGTSRPYAYSWENERAVNVATLAGILMRIAFPAW